MVYSSMLRFSALFVVIFAILPNLVWCLPAAASTPTKSALNKPAPTKSAAKTSSKPKAAPAAAATNMPMMAANGPSMKQVANAVMNWMNDTGKVTNFLNTASSLTGDEYTKQATIALNAEKDELNHKAILDVAVGMMDSVQAANATLAGMGKFQDVVDVLQTSMSLHIMSKEVPES